MPDRKDYLLVMEYYKSLPEYLKTPEMNLMYEAIKQKYVNEVGNISDKNAEEPDWEVSAKVHKKLTKPSEEYIKEHPAEYFNQSALKDTKHWWQKLDKELAASFGKGINEMAEAVGGLTKQIPVPFVSNIGENIVQSATDQQKYYDELQEKGFHPETLQGKIPLYALRGITQMAPQLPAIEYTGLPLFMALIGGGKAGAEEGAGIAETAKGAAVGGAEGLLLHGVMKGIAKINPKLANLLSKYISDKGAKWVTTIAAKATGGGVFGGLSYAGGERDPAKLAAETFLGVIMTPGMKDKPPEKIAEEVVNKFEENVKNIWEVTPEGEVKPPKVLPKKTVSGEQREDRQSKEEEHKANYEEQIPTKSKKKASETPNKPVEKSLPTETTETTTKTKAVEIPQFKSTEEALAFGEKHKGNKEVVEKLKELEAQAKSEYDKIPTNSDENINKKMRVSFKKQLYREAREVAEGKAEATLHYEKKSKEPFDITQKKKPSASKKNISLRKWVRNKGGIKQSHLSEHGINWKEERGLALQVAAKKDHGNSLDDLAKTAIEEKVIPEPPNDMNPTDWFIKHLRENKRVGEHLENVSDENIYKSKEYVEYTYNELQKKGAIADDLSIDKFAEMLKNNKEPEKIHTGDLKVGDEFTIGGEKFKVTKHIGDELEIADGVKKRVPDTFDYITIDKGSLKKGAAKKESLLEQQMSVEQKDKFKGGGSVGKKAWHSLEERKEAYEKIKKQRQKTGQKDLFYDREEQKSIFDIKKPKKWNEVKTFEDYKEKVISIAKRAKWKILKKDNNGFEYESIVGKGKVNYKEGYKIFSFLNKIKKIKNDYSVGDRVKFKYIDDVKTGKIERIYRKRNGEISSVVVGGNKIKIEDVIPFDKSTIGELIHDASMVRDGYSYYSKNNYNRVLNEIKYYEKQKADLPRAETVKGSPKEAKAAPVSKKNPYLKMPMDRVRADAINGVKLAQEAWKEREGAKSILSHKEELSKTLSGREFVKGLIKSIAKDLSDPTQLSSNFAGEYKNVREFLKKHKAELTDEERAAILNFYRAISKGTTDEKQIAKQMTDYLTKNFSKFSPLNDPSKPVAEKIVEARKAKKEIEKSIEEEIKDPKVEAGNKTYSIERETFDIDLHERVLSAVGDEMVRKGIKRDSETFPVFSDQIRTLIETGQIKYEEINKKYGISESEWLKFWREEIGNWARGLQAIKRTQDFVIKGAGLKDIDKKTQDLLNELAKINSWDKMRWTFKRVDNIRRGLMVSQFSTAVRNAYAQGWRIMVDVPETMLEIALGKMFKLPDYDKLKIMDAFDLVANLKRGNRILLEKIFEKAPELEDMLYARYASDVLKGTRRGDILGKAENIVDVLNWANRLQEFTIRNAAFLGKLEIELAKRGINFRERLTELRKLRDKKSPDFEDKAKEFFRDIKKSEIKKAVNYALEATWADRPKSRIAKDVLHFINSFPMLPWGTGTFPFGRFAILSTRYLYERSPFGLLSLIKPSNRDLKPAIISKAIVGSIMLGTAYMFRNSEYAGEKWYEVKINNKYYDVRMMFPFASYFFLADVIKRLKNGTLGNMSTADWMRGVLSVNVRAGFGAYMIDWLANAISNTRNAKKFLRYMEDYAGQIGASFLTPLNMINDFVAGIDKEAAKLRNTRLSPVAQIQEKIPYIRRKLPEKKSPLEERAQVKGYPWLKLFTGVIRKDDKNFIEREVDRLGLTYQEVYPRTGDKELDNLVVGEMGKMVERTLLPMMKTDFYKRMSDAKKALFITDELRRIKRAAKMKVISEGKIDREKVKELRYYRLPYRKRKVLDEMVNTLKK